MEKASSWLSPKGQAGLNSRASLQGHSLWLQHRQHLKTDRPWRQLSDAKRKPGGSKQKKCKKHKCIRLLRYSFQVRQKLLLRQVPTPGSLPWDPAGSMPVSSSWAPSCPVIAKWSPGDSGLFFADLQRPHFNISAHFVPNLPLKGSSHPQATELCNEGQRRVLCSQLRSVPVGTSLRILTQVRCSLCRRLIQS